MKETREKSIIKRIYLKEKSKRNMQNKKGITLIALVITIIVLLILLGITINLLFSNGGIFDIANQAKPSYEIGAIKDRINNALGDWYIDKGLDPTTPIDDLWDKMVVEDIIDDPEEDVDGPEKVGENDSYEITTNEGYIVEIIVTPDGDIIIEDIVEGNSLPPKIGKITTSSSSNSINVEVEVTRSEGEIRLSYYYKKDGEEESSYKALKEGVEDLTAEFTELEQNVVYNIKIVVKDNNGTAEKVINEKTAISGATEGLQEGNIIASEPKWSGGQASINLSKGEEVASNLSIEYQVGGVTEGKWTTGTSVTGLSHNSVVYARLTDGENVGSYPSVTILDEINPQEATINLSGTNTTTTGNVTATVTHKDEESGVEIENCKWIYNTTSSKIGTEGSSYTNTFSSNGETITLSTSSVGTYYLHVLTEDKAGNKVETISQGVTVVLPNAAPTTPTVNFSSKTTNSITVTANATDPNNDKLTYKLYVSTSQSSGFSQAATTSAIASGSTVTLTASSLSQYTNYYYYVTVTDGELTTTSSTSRAVRTYCPGNTYYCKGGSSTTDWVTCPTCSGGGTKYECLSCGRVYYIFNINGCNKCGSMLVNSSSCDTCLGLGKIEERPHTCEHGYYSEHYYCSHGYTGQHD